MKVVGMDTRMSIEFFLLTCCIESWESKKISMVKVAMPYRKIKMILLYPITIKGRSES